MDVFLDIVARWILSRDGWVALESHSPADHGRETVRCLLPLRNLRGNLEIGDHEEIDAFACAMTALCVAARRFVAVGSEVDGYIILPPSNCWGRGSDGAVAWARVELLKNLKSVVGDMSRPAIYEDRREWARSLLPERKEQSQRLQS